MARYESDSSPQEFDLGSDPDWRKWEEKAGRTEPSEPPDPVTISGDQQPTNPIADLENLIVPRADWITKARCADPRSELKKFLYPTSPAKQEKATEVCRTCPVRPNCLLLALETEVEVRQLRQRDGIWGGTTPRMRDRIQKLIDSGEISEPDLMLMSFDRVRRLAIPEKKSRPTDVSDSAWGRIEPLIRKGNRGRKKRLIDRDMVDAIFYKLSDDEAQWKHLPHDLPHGEKCRQYYRAWVEVGVWDKIETIVQEERTQATA